MLMAVALAKRNRKRDLGGPACSDLMAGEDIDVEGPGHRCALDQVRDEVVYPRIFLVCVTLCILLTFPKAQREDLVRLGIRYEQNLVHEPRLVFKDWEDLIVNSSRKLLRFSLFGPDSDDSTEHSVPPFGSAWSDKAYARRVQGSIAEKWCSAQVASDVRKR